MYQINRTTCFKIYQLMQYIKKMEKRFILKATAISLLLAHSSLSEAQVTIGGATAPSEFSVLELMSNNTRGFRLPQMTTAQRDIMAEKFGSFAKTEAMGLQIFNISNYCVETWNGTKWISQCAEEEQEKEPLIPLPPNEKFPEVVSGNICLSGNIYFDVAQTNGGEACGDLSNTNLRNPDFSIQARTYTLSGNVSELKFYILNNEIDENSNYVYSISQSGNSVTLEFENGMRELMAQKKGYFTLLAQFKDNADNQYKQMSLDITVQDCMRGTVLNSGVCSWIRFMPYNLGADPMLSVEQQMAFNSPRHNLVLPSSTASNAAVHGDFYQWGRQKDGHEKRNSQNYPTNSISNEAGQLPANTVFDENGQVPRTHPAYGKFIKQNVGTHDWRRAQSNTLWNTGTEENPVKHANNDPCPQGWRIPTRNELLAIHAHNDRELIGTFQASGTATGTPGLLYKARTSGTGKEENDKLFLPAAGYHHLDGALWNVGTSGYYWSSTPEGENAHYLNFSHDNLTAPEPPYHPNFWRGYGFSIRCVVE